MMRAIFLAAFILCASAGPALAFPEFQVFIKSNSGRNVDCAYCHEHPDGPVGAKPGQIGSLDTEEMARLGRARLSFEPGSEVDSPILNEFGDRILFTTGKQRFDSLRQSPAELAVDLEGSDLDGDGIADDIEYQEGTHPLFASSGSPWRLLEHNAYELRYHLILLLIATFLGVFGLNHLLRWYALSVRRVVDQVDHAAAAANKNNEDPQLEASALLEDVESPKLPRRAAPERS